MEELGSQDITIHELEAELDRLDTSIEGVEAMSRYLGVANGAIAFSIISFVGSLLSGGVEVDDFTRWTVVISVLSGILAAAFGLFSIQSFTSARRAVATARELYTKGRWDYAREVIKESYVARRHGVVWSFYVFCGCTGLSASFACTAFARMVAP